MTIISFNVINSNLKATKICPPFMMRCDSNENLNHLLQHWKKMTQIPQKHDFLTCNIQNFVRKVKQLVRKYIT